MILKPDGSYQLFNETAREAPAGFMKVIGVGVWLDDEHIGISSSVFSLSGGATTSYWSAFNLESG